MGVIGLHEASTNAAVTVTITTNLIGGVLGLSRIDEDWYEKRLVAFDSPPVPLVSRSASNSPPRKREAMSDGPKSYNHIDMVVDQPTGVPNYINARPISLLYLGASMMSVSPAT